MELTTLTDNVELEDRKYFRRQHGLRTTILFYADIKIDYEALECLHEDGIPQDLQTVEDPQSNREQDISEEHTEEEIPQQSHSFLSLPQGHQQYEQDAIRTLINGVDPLDWPSNDGDPIKEFSTEGLASMAFPTLFPYRRGDPTKRTRPREVLLTEGFKHLTKYAELSTNGTFTW